MMVSVNELIIGFKSEFYGQFQSFISEQLSKFGFELNPFYLLIILSVSLGFYVKRRMQAGFIWWILLSYTFYTLLRTWGL